MWQVIAAGVILGLISSLHCIGMCGPLALALPVSHPGKGYRFLAHVLYTMGRIITYSSLGLLFGLAGRRVYLAGFQQWFSIVLGVMILLIALYYFFFRRYIRLPWLNAFHMRVQPLMGRFLHRQRMSSFLLLGILNGLLPCGMVYLAIAGALSTADAGKAALFMGFFGMGTAPAMLVLGLLGYKLKISLRQQAKKIIPYMVSAMAVLLILRGLNLGIPFISPVMVQAPQQVITCH